MSDEIMKATELPPPGPDLIRLALDDLEKCEADPNVTINMRVWLEPDDEDLNDTCQACLAGAVLLKSLEIVPAFKHTPRWRDWGEFCNFLNDARLGKLIPINAYVDVVNYEDDPALFKEQLQWIADNWHHDNFEEAYNLNFKGR